MSAIKLLTMKMVLIFFVHCTYPALLSLISIESSAESGVNLISRMRLVI